MLLVILSEKGITQDLRFDKWILKVLQRFFQWTIDIYNDLSAITKSF